MSNEQSTQSSISPSRRTGRVFGYLGLSVVWLVLLALAAAIFSALPLIFASMSTDWGGGLMGSPGFENTASDPMELYVYMPIALIISAFVFGYVAYVLFMATVSNLLLAATYFFRSLNPVYNDEPLSTTKWVDGTMLALPRGNKGSTAISLLPVRKTKWTMFWATRSLLAFSGFSWGIIGASFFVGLAYIVTVGWVFWPVTNPALIAVWSVVSLVTFGLGLYGLNRAMSKMLTK